jgi:transposase-like protein
MDNSTKDKKQLLAFYDFPVLHCLHIWTTHPIEWIFATVELRVARVRNCVSQKTVFVMVFKLSQKA